MWALVIFLWAVVVPGPAAAVDCGLLRIQLNGTSGGGQTLLLSAEPPSCHCPRMALKYLPCARDDALCGAGGKVVLGNLTTERTTAGWRAGTTVFLAGWYRVYCCAADILKPCNRMLMAEAWVDGLNCTSWNVSISAEQTPGAMPQLSVEVTGQPDPYPEQLLYLPHLDVRLVNATNGHRVDSGNIVYPGNNSYVFGRDERLRYGLYHIEVKPKNLLLEGNCLARYISYTFIAPEESPAAELTVDTAASQTVYVVLGVLTGVALFCLAGFLSHSFLYGQRGRRWRDLVHTVSQISPLPRSPASAVPVTVLLLHRGGGGAALDKLRAALRAAGIVLLDARERCVLNLMQTYPSPAELLALEAFRDARLLFVGGGEDGVAGSVQARVYDNVLKFVRNGRLGLDYGRVYAATLGEVAGDELAGLVEGRLFRVPADMPALIEHILCARRPPLARLSSTESQTDLLPAMLLSSVSADPSPQPSPV